MRLRVCLVWLVFCVDDMISLKRRLLYHGLFLRARGFCYQNECMQKKTTAKTIFDQRYDRLISDLVKIRHEKGFTQRSFAAKTGYSKCFVGRTETKERRLDFIETLDYMKNLGLSKKEIAEKVAVWLREFG